MRCIDGEVFRMDGLRQSQRLLEEADGIRRVAAAVEDAALLELATDGSDGGRVVQLAPYVCQHRVGVAEFVLHAERAGQLGLHLQHIILVAARFCPGTAALVEHAASATNRPETNMGPIQKG